MTNLATITLSGDNGIPLVTDHELESIAALLDSVLLFDTSARSLALNIIEKSNTLEIVEALATVLPHTQITSFDLSCSNIKAEEVQVIAAILPSTKITKIDLHGNEIKTAGAIALAKVLSNT